MSRLFVDKLTNGVTLGLEFIADNAEDEGRAAIAKKLLAALDGCAVSELLSVLAEAAGSAGDVVDDMRTSGEPLWACHEVSR